jgi:hypothetical protein
MLPNGSFKIPRGSAATSAPVCVTRFSPTIRFFLRNDGKSGARLRVDALFKGGSGKIQQVPVATVAGTTSWAPTAPLPLLLNAMTSIAKQDAMGVAFRFTAITGNWKIDRIYVDPLKDS